jgi:hypothetical protein
MCSHYPFGYLKHKLWSKEGSRIKLPIWLPTNKSRESPWVICMQVACHIILKRSWQGLQLFFKPYLNRRSTQKVMNLQSCRRPNLGNFGAPNLGVPGQNDIWVLVPWLAIGNTIRGKVVPSPKSRPRWIMWVCVCSCFVRAPKVL